jgi:hypothetical protein
MVRPPSGVANRGTVRFPAEVKRRQRGRPAHDTASAMPRAAGKTTPWQVAARTQRSMSADSAIGYFPLLAGVVDVAMICHVPPLRDHTCRL